MTKYRQIEVLKSQSEILKQKSNRELDQAMSVLGLKYGSAQRKLEILEIELKSDLVQRSVGLEVGRIDNEVWEGEEGGR